MVKWKAVIGINGGEYEGWVTFFPCSVAWEEGNDKVLLVDGQKMEFDECVIGLYRDVE